MLQNGPIQSIIAPPFSNFKHGQDDPHVQVKPARPISITRVHHPDSAKRDHLLRKHGHGDGDERLDDEQHELVAAAGRHDGA